LEVSHPLRWKARNGWGTGVCSRSEDARREPLISSSFPGTDIPQGLKPIDFAGFIGTTKVVPFQDIDLFRHYRHATPTRPGGFPVPRSPGSPVLRSCPFKTLTFFRLYGHATPTRPDPQGSRFPGPALSKH